MQPHAEDCCELKQPSLIVYGSLPFRDVDHLTALHSPWTMTAAHYTRADSSGFKSLSHGCILFTATTSLVLFKSSSIYKNSLPLWCNDSEVCLQFEKGTMIVVSFSWQSQKGRDDHRYCRMSGSWASTLLLEKTSRPVQRSQFWKKHSPPGLRMVSPQADGVSLQVAPKVALHPSGWHLLVWV